MDHDRLFKELLTTFFFEFIALFLPDVAKYLDHTYLEFLDKEIFTDIQSGERREIDLLAKVRFLDGKMAFFLIHVEVQASSRSRFPRRMFLYFARLDEKFDLPILPVALFSYDEPMREEPNRYTVDFPDFRVVDFAFRPIQLNTLNWRDYLRNPNPVASALMTKMRIAPEDRPRVKLECLRMLATLKLDRARSTLISAFMDAYLKLTAAETIVYNRELEAIEPKEREAVMQWTNEWIEQGKAEGLQQGLQEGVQRGLQQGRRQTVLRQLRRRFGAMSEDLLDKINRLNELQLDDLTDAILDFQRVADAEAWLAGTAES